MANRNQLVNILLRAVSDGNRLDTREDLEELAEYLSENVAPVKHGRWIEQEAPNMDTYYDCSACGESFCFIDGSPEDNLYTYCPNCGAKMDLEETE